MTDCLIIGFNDTDFGGQIELARSMGVTSGAYRDIDLAFVRHDGRPLRALDVVNCFAGEAATARPFHNTDFLWPTILYLGSYLARHGLTFDYVNLFQRERDKLRHKLEDDPPLAVAITTTLYVTPQPILEVVSFVRRHAPGTRIVVGGPFVANQARIAEQEHVRTVLDYIGADVYVISHEGERTLVRLLEALRAGADLAAVENLAYREGDVLRFTAEATESNPLAENMTDYGLFPRADVGELVSLRTAKSCPFSCAFCGFPRRAGRYTYLPVDLVERELDSLRQVGARTITFLDDTFNVPRGRFKDVLRMMIRNEYGFRWNSFYRADQGDEETIDLMARAGCEGVFIGVESGSDTMLRQMAKTARREDYLRAIPRLREAGIVVHANLIVGFPGETDATLAETEELLEATRPDFYRAQLWYADPATPVWERREELGVRGSGFTWSHQTMDATTAAGHVERLFMSIEGSLWLPQHGFELWSVFYLRRRGWTLGAIRELVRCFNAGVKVKLLEGPDAELGPELTEALRSAARREHLSARAAEAVVSLGGDRMRAAERYWLRDPSGLPAELGALHTVRAPGRAVDATAAACGVSSDDVALAAAAVAAARAAGRDEVLVLCEDGLASTPVPLRVAPDVSFGRLVADAAAERRAASEHARFAGVALGGWAKRGTGAARAWDATLSRVGGEGGDLRFDLRLPAGADKGEISRVLAAAAPDILVGAIGADARDRGELFSFRRVL